MSDEGCALQSENGDWFDVSSMKVSVPLFRYAFCG